WQSFSRFESCLTGTTEEYFGWHSGYLVDFGFAQSLSRSSKTIFLFSATLDTSWLGPKCHPVGEISARKPASSHLTPGPPYGILSPMSAYAPSRRLRVFVARLLCGTCLLECLCTLPSKGLLESVRPPSPAFFKIHLMQRSCWKYLRRIRSSLISTPTANATLFKPKYFF